MYVEALVEDDAQLMELMLRSWLIAVMLVLIFMASPEEEKNPEEIQTTMVLQKQELITP